MRSVLLKLMLSAAAIAPLLAGSARADVLLDETKLIGLPTVAQPSEHAFTAAAAEALTVTLTDFQAPAAFVSLQVAVTLGDTLVGSVKVDPTSHKATLPVPAAPGNYVVRVIGTPDATQGIGSFGACVTRDADTMRGRVFVLRQYSNSGDAVDDAVVGSEDELYLDCGRYLLGHDHR
jgi:hypothetical protein